MNVFILENFASSLHYSIDESAKAACIVFTCLPSGWCPVQDLRSLASQLMHAYGHLRKTDRPVKLHLTSYRGAAAEALKRVSGDDWKVFRHEAPFHEVFDKSKLVYLSPDATEVLSTLNENDIYVIGGLVDDNKLLVRVSFPDDFLCCRSLGTIGCAL